MYEKLSPFERWMVQSNLKTIANGKATVDLVATLRNNGYPKIAAAVVERRLEHIRSQIQHEYISYGEIFELQSLASEIKPDDVELLQWAGVPEGDTA